MKIKLIFIIFGKKFPIIEPAPSFEGAGNVIASLVREFLSVELTASADF